MKYMLKELKMLILKRKILKMIIKLNNRIKLNYKNKWNYIQKILKKNKELNKKYI